MLLKFELNIECAVIYSVIFLILTLLVFLLCDVQYFARSFFVLAWGRFFEKKKKPEEATVIYGICTTTDLDIMFKHMNNARYVRELDFARFHFYERTGIYYAIKAAKGIVVQSACTIKYRRPIPLFSRYKVTTKLIYWDDKAIYLEQQFISLNDGFVRAVALSKQGVVGAEVPEIMAKLVEKEVSYRPQAPPDLDHFISCMDASSARLRKKDN